jgi:hypothetical protein
MMSSLEQKVDDAFCEFVKRFAQIIDERTQDTSPISKEELYEIYCCVFSYLPGAAMWYALVGGIEHRTFAVWSSSLFSNNPNAFTEPEIRGYLNKIVHNIRNNYEQIVELIQ